MKYVLVVMDDDSNQDLLAEEIELGLDGEVIAYPVTFDGFGRYVTSEEDAERLKAFEKGDEVVRRPRASDH